MKIIRFLSVVFLVTIICVLSGFGLSYKAMTPKMEERPLEIKFEEFEALPEKVDLNEAPDFANIAWRTFVTLNWPASYNGSPLEQVALGKAPLAPRVWEFYPTPEEVFLPNAQNPLLNTPNSFTRVLKLDLFEGQGSGSESFDWSTILQESRKSIQEINSQVNSGENITLISETKKLSLNKMPVVDRRGNYIILESHLNRNEFNQIVKNNWYDANTLAGYKENNFKFESTNPSEDSPIEIKAAWRVFDERTDRSEKARYYTTKRILAIPKHLFCANDNCRSTDTALQSDRVLREVEVGLIGFHIAYKIPNQEGSNPGWIWGTFEQVDTLRVDDNLKFSPTLSNPNCEKNQNIENCQPNFPYVESPFLWRDKAPYAVTRTKDEEIKEQIPTHVVRLSEMIESIDRQLNRNTKNSLKELDDDTKNIIKEENQKWQEAFRKVDKRSVWQYYELLGVQWLKDPNIISEEDSYKELLQTIRNQMHPGMLVNVSMEAYSQYQKYGNSCIGCHVTSTLPSSQNESQKFSDFSFMLERAEKSSNS